MVARNPAAAFTGGPNAGSELDTRFWHGERSGILPRGIGRYSVLVAAALFVASCQTADMSSFGDSAMSVKDLPDVSYYKTDELVTLGKTNFKERNFGQVLRALQARRRGLPRRSPGLAGLRRLG